MSSSSRSRRAWLASVSAALTLSAAVLVPAGEASALTTITVDFSGNLGAPTYRASGTLYGMTEDGANPPDQFYRNIKWRFERAGGAQLAGSGWVGGGYTRRWNSVLAQARRTAALGGTFVLLPHDLWGADGAAISTWPGDNGNWTNFDNFLNQLISDVQTSGLSVQWDIWNEPDLSIFWRPSQSQYLAMWARAYRRIRGAFPNAVIVGPSTAGQPSSGSAWWGTYLDYVRTNNVVPDIFSWHTLPGDPVTSKANADSVLSSRGISTRPYQINEYGAAGQQHPGGGGWYIARLERAGIDGLRANWASGSALHNFAAGLLTGSTGQYQPKGEWHTYNFYASMTGTRVNLTASGNLDGVATKDTSAGNAKVLLGNNGTTDTVNLSLTRLDTTSVVRNGQVRVVVQRVPFNGGGAVSGPVTVADNIVPVTGNTATVSVNWTDARDGYTFTLLAPDGTGDTTPPTAPAGLAASGTTATSTNLSWTASTDNVGVTGYDILRAPGASGGTFAVVGTSTTTSFTNAGLTANTTYRYQVRARDAAGNLSPVSNTVQVTTTGGNTGGCTATPTVQSQWATGYVIQPLTITNTGTTTLNGWTVTFTLPAGHTLTGSWNATVTTSGQTVTARNVSHNGTIAPGASITSFGFQAGRPNGNTALPSGYTCTSP